MKALFALLCVLGGGLAQAQTWTPVSSEFDQSVVVKTYKTVNWRFGGSTSWDVRSRPAGEYRCTVGSWTSPPTNGVNPRPGNGNYCEIADVSALQPIAPPSVVLPPGVVKKANRGDSFTFNAPTRFRFCSADALTCTPEKYWTGLPAGASMFCTEAVFGGLAVGTACFEFPGPVQVPLTLVWSVDPFAYDDSETPVSVSTRYPHTVVWLEGGKAYGTLYSDEEFTAAKRALWNALKAAIAAADKSAFDKSINDWVKSRPLEILTAAEMAHLTAKKAQLQPVAFTMWVSPITAGTRPYYKANGALTATSGSKLGDVAVKTPCDASKRLGTTSYYWVPSVSGYAVCVLKS